MLAPVLCGPNELRIAVFPAAERDELDLEVPAACVGRCLEAAVETPRDLVGRVMSSDTHQEAWIKRCRALETDGDG